MGSDQDNDNNNVGDRELPTSIIPELDDRVDQPTEEVSKKPENPIADLPTIARKSDHPIADLPTMVRPPSSAQPIAIPDPDDPGPEQSVGMFLEEDEDENTVGIHLEELDAAAAEHTLAEFIQPEGLRHSETIGQFLEPETQGSAPIQNAETLIRKDTPWKQLHPVSLAVNLLPRAWQTIRSMWPILLLVVVGKGDSGMRALDLAIILLFTLTSVWNTFIHWVTLRYRIHNGRLEITSGLINKQARTIDPIRIQNVELVQNLFHKWAGLVELRIDTAGEQNTEGLLSALSVSEAEDLRNQLAAVGSLAAAGRSNEERGDPITSMGLAEILAYGLTQRTIGTVAIITAVGLELLTQAGPEVTAEFTGSMQPTMIIAAFMLAFVASWTVSAMTSIFRYFGYKMTRFEDVIRTECGLTTRRRVEIPLSKVQLVRTDEPLLRRLMGYGTLLVETAGLGVVEGQVRQAEGIVPMVEEPDLGRVASEAVPHANVDPWTTTLKPAHPRALYRAIMAASFRALVLALMGWMYLTTMKWAILLFFPIAWVSAWLDWQKQGWVVTPTAIVSRRGFFNRRTFILSRDKLQSVHVVQGPFMRLHGLSRLVIRVAGSQVSLPDTGSDDTQWLYRELTA